MKNLLSLLKQDNNETLYNIVYSLLKEGKGRYIQEQVNTLIKKKLIVDGIVGYNTIRGLLTPNNFDMVNSLLGVIPEEIEITGKEKILSYLGNAEGVVIHWNKGESALTTPYGVYAKSFPNSKPVKYVQALAVKYTGSKIRARRLSEISKVNVSLTLKEKEKLKDLCWDFYKDNFIHEDVIPLLDSKSNLSYFSCSVNGGRRRGAKVLQTAVKAKSDGMIGKGTLRKISKAVKNNIDINKGILDAMKRYYDYLIRVNPAKFKRFRNGWYNRIKGLR